MKILHLRTSNFYGGPERQLHFHAKEATDSGCEIIIGSFLEDGQSPEFINVISDDNILTQTFNVSGGYDLKAIKLVREFLIDKNISILCTHDYRSHLIGMMARRKTLAKWIAFSRGWTSEDIKIKFYHMLDKIFIRYANHVVAVSESQKLRLTKLLVSKNKITTVHNAIDPKAFAHVEAVDLRDKFDLPQNSIIGISGGRFSAEKG
ncbi:MAG: glycosyltransferase family 4 protein, partial [candidate division Zixibacteria bacterium]|nr:glycosyltransferase family 4 protein [candidate division Zixibacteria bacterium]